MRKFELNGIMSNNDFEYWLDFKIPINIRPCPLPISNYYGKHGMNKYNSFKPIELNVEYLILGNSLSEDRCFFFKLNILHIGFYGLPLARRAIKFILHTNACFKNTAGLL